MTPQDNNNSTNNSRREENICIHIFSVSAAMVGVCLTVIGLVRVVITLGKADTLADDLLALDAVLFLTTSLLSYTALRAPTASKMKRFERFADWLFILSMTLMVVICAFIAYAISIPPSGK
ncbi:MAG: hypothetical protein ACJ8M1_03460 [Chthoniobacterales bacterium]